MKTIGRRSFLRNLLTGGVLAGTGAAQVLQVSQAMQAATQDSGNTQSLKPPHG